MSILRSLVIIVCIGGIFFYQFFIYSDRSSNCFITILPSLTEFSNITIKRSLNTLKHAAPDHYADVCKNVKTISPNFGCGGVGGGCYYQGEPDTIYISTTMNDLVGAAAIIVHETCHVIQGKESRSFDENECYEIDDTVFKTLTAYE